MGARSASRSELLAKLSVTILRCFTRSTQQVMAGKDQLFPVTLLQAITKSSHDPDYPKDSACIFTVDLATGKRADADHSVVAVGRSDISGRVWIADCIGGVLTPARSGDDDYQQGRAVQAGPHPDREAARRRVLR
jgi:hypothetical protein